MLESSGNSIKKDFVNELKDYIPSLKRNIDDLKTNPSHKEALRELHRLVHTIKGAASLVKIDGLSSLAAQMENVLEEVIGNRLTLDDDVFSAMSCVIEHLDACVNGFLAEGIEDRQAVNDALAALERIPSRTSSDADDHRPVNLLSLTESSDLSDLGLSSCDIVINEDDLPTDDFWVDEDALCDPGIPPGDESEDIDLMQQELLDGFYLEADEHFQDLGNALNQLEVQVAAPTAITSEHKELLRQIRRSVHTIKGAAAVIKLEAIAAWGHAFEDLLDWLYEQAGDITPAIIQLIADAADMLEHHVTSPHQVDQDKADAIKAEFKRIIGPGSGVAATADSDDEDSGYGTAVELQIPPAVQPDVSTAGAAADIPDTHQAPMPTGRAKSLRVDIDKVEALVNLASELIIALSAFDQRMDGFGGIIGELDRSRLRLKDTARDLEVGYEVKAIQHLGSHQSGLQTPLTATSDGSGAFEDFDLLELDRYSEFNLIIRSLNETAVDVGTINTQLSDIHSGFESYLNRLRILLSELQEKVMRVRMTPMSMITNRLRRTVRETAAQLGKTVHLVVKGDEIELDKMVWEKLADPLMHLLRNAIDHGIEPAMTRQARGKPVEGAIHLKAAYQGNQVILHVSDDGAGLDYELIGRTAKAAGFKCDLDTLSEDKLADMIFYPGFSTRRDISAVSGRGIGLDVVKENITALKGTVNVEKSAKEAGTTFRIRIPLTLAVMRALLFTVNDRLFAAALNDIKEILRVPSKALMDKQGKAVKIGERVLPLHYLTDILTGPGPTHKRKITPMHPLALVIDTGTWQGAVVIDSMFSQREIVIKDLGSHLHHVQGIAGATVMGDGKVVPIVNFEELFSSESAPPRTAERVQLDELNRPLEIMVVDDSVSVRTVVSRLMQRQGWGVQIAKDGVEALEQLQGYRPDLIVLDIEMPRMNGYEFMSALRSQENFKDLPVIMLTSRAAKKHRVKARNLGVNGFVVKPYEDEEFLALVKRLTGGSAN